MVRLGPGGAHVPSKDTQEASSPATSLSAAATAAAAATLSHVRLISFSNQVLRSTELAPLTSVPSLHALSTSADRSWRSLDDHSFGVCHNYALLNAPCVCHDATMLAPAGTGDHACMEKVLLYKPSIQSKTWRMLGSLAKSSCLIGNCVQYTRIRFGMDRLPSRGDVTKILAHGSFIFTAHQDHKIRVWKHSTSSFDKHKLLNTLPTPRDYFLNCFSQQNYVQIRRHHHCLWIQHVDTISALTVGGACAGDNEGSHNDHELLYSASWDKTFKVWSLSDNFKCMESVVAHSDAINAIIFGSCRSAAVHQQLIYTASSDGTVKAWSKQAINTRRLRRGSRSMRIKHRLVATLPDHKCVVNALAISSDGTVLFSAGSDGLIRVWKRSVNDHKITAGQRVHMTLCSILEGHKRAVLCICIAGDLLLSGSADKTLRAWFIGNLEREVSSDHHDNGDSHMSINSCLAIMQGHKAPIKSVCASPARLQYGSAGCTICTEALDMAIKVWWLPTNNNNI